jgi:hypothetical protein
MLLILASICGEVIVRGSRKINRGILPWAWIAKNFQGAQSNRVTIRRFNELSETF